MNSRVCDIVVWLKFCACPEKTSCSSGNNSVMMSASMVRESVQLKTVMELYDMEINQKISMTNYQKLKTIAKRSIGQKNFDCET